MSQRWFSSVFGTVRIARKYSTLLHAFAPSLVRPPPPLKSDPSTSSPPPSFCDWRLNIIATRQKGNPLNLAYASPLITVWSGNAPEEILRRFHRRTRDRPEPRTTWPTISTWVVKRTKRERFTPSRHGYWGERANTAQLIDMSINYALASENARRKINWVKNSKYQGGRINVRKPWTVKLKLWWKITVLVSFCFVMLSIEGLLVNFVFDTEYGNDKKKRIELQTRKVRRVSINSMKPTNNSKNSNFGK